MAHRDEYSPGDSQYDVLRKMLSQLSQIAGASAGLSPGEESGHVSQEIHASGVTAAGVLFTVPAGKVLKLHTIQIVATNSSTTSAAVMHLHDGGVGGTEKISVVVEEKTGSVNKVGNSVVTYQEPLRFYTDVYFHVHLGTLVEADVHAVGYLDTLE